VWFDRLLRFMFGTMAAIVTGTLVEAHANTQFVLLGAFVTIVWAIACGVEWGMRIFKREFDS
jgi:hypothetical protein